jgi:hypothetical protein
MAGTLSFTFFGTAARYQPTEFSFLFIPNIHVAPGVYTSAFWLADSGLCAMPSFELRNLAASAPSCVLSYYQQTWEPEICYHH